MRTHPIIQTPTVLTVKVTRIRYNGGITWQIEMLEDNTKMKHLSNMTVRRPVVHTRAKKKLGSVVCPPIEIFHIRDKNKWKSYRKIMETGCLNLLKPSGNLTYDQV
jgi:hypothetical protein